MSDRETVITHLQIIHTWAEFARERGMCFSDTHLENIAQWTDDAIAMLKDHEIVLCKDCRWGDRSRNRKGEEMILCYNGDTGIEDGYLHEPDWYCREGERAVK